MSEQQSRPRPRPPLARRPVTRHDPRPLGSRDGNASGAPAVRSMAMTAECRCPQACIRDHEHE